MKQILLAGVLTFGFAAASVGSSQESADADWAELKAASWWSDDRPMDAGESLQKRVTESEQSSQLLREKGLVFYGQHPADPRRWIVVAQMLERPPQFITSYGPNFERNPNDVTIDAGAAAAWRARLDGLLDAAIVAPDVPGEVHEALDFRDVSRRVRPFLKNNQADAAEPTVELMPALAKLAAFAVRYPESRKPFEFLPLLAYRYKLSVPSEKNGAVWRLFSDSPNRPLAEMAAAQLRFFALARQPLEMQFTAADGRLVDLGQLRGKVVLIDFWATWCKPCVAELPNVKKVYEAYHDRGFEVVGIALENGQISPDDTAEQAADKLAKAKKKLTDFTAAHELPWPQHFDGKYWQNDFATRYAIGLIPAMFLLDQQGNLVTTNARGEALEVAVKKLLQL